MNLSVRADIKKNRLYFSIKGTVTKKELDQLYTDVRFCVADLQPGFGVISDYSNCSLATLSALPTYRKIMNYLIMSKAGEVIRVMDGESLIFRQAINLASRLQGYKPIYVTSIEEAEEKLDQLSEQLGLRFCLFQLPVEYTFDDQSGKGRILDISVGGCTIESTPPFPGEGDGLQLALIFHNTSAQNDRMQLSGEVVTVEGKKFSVQFTDITEEQEEQLLAGIICETQREMDCL